jgi:hypothetical protein
MLRGVGCEDVGDNESLGCGLCILGYGLCIMDNG